MKSKNLILIIIGWCTLPLPAVTGVLMFLPLMFNTPNIFAGETNILQFIRPILSILIPISSWVLVLWGLIREYKRAKKAEKQNEA